MSDTKIFYVTKWWRTRGILIGKKDAFDHGGWVSCAGFSHKIGKDAFLNLQEAMARVRSMAANKASTFQKQADRCRKIAVGDRDVEVASS